MPEFCTCHGSLAAMACAKSWHDWLISFQVRATSIFQDLDYELVNTLWQGCQLTGHICAQHMQASMNQAASQHVTGTPQHVTGITHDRDNPASAWQIAVRDHFVYASSQWETTLQCNIQWETVRRHYSVTSSVIDWAHSQNDPCTVNLVSQYYMPVLVVIAKIRPHIGGVLTHWGWDKIDAISQTTFSSTFSWMKMFEFRLKFHWSLFLRVELTIFQHWFR